MDKAKRKQLIRVIQIVVSLAIIVGIFGFAIPKIANYGDVWNAVKEMTWLEITSLIAVSALNILTYWPLMVASMPGLTLGQAAANIQSSTSIGTSMPFGGCIATGVA